MRNKTFRLHVLTGILLIGYVILLVFTAIHNVRIFLFFVLHRYVSLFFQSFFLHRYAAHAMVVMKKGRQRLFHLMTYITQGSSYLIPSAYAILHRLHHKHSDTKDDPHSPIFFTDIFMLMHQTKKIYHDIVQNSTVYAKGFAKNYPMRKSLDNRGATSVSRVLRVVVYVAIYVLLGAQRRMFFLLPVHVLMSPVHGAIVNRFGHMVGYVNHTLDDHSRNTLPIDFVTLGELFQNNHHKYATKPNFANRTWELDVTYWIIRGMAALHIVRFR